MFVSHTLITGDCGDSSAVSSTCCSWRGSQFSSSTHSGWLQLPLASTVGYHMPSSGFYGPHKNVNKNNQSVNQSIKGGMKKI